MSEEIRSWFIDYVQVFDTGIRIEGNEVIHDHPIVWLHKYNSQNKFAKHRSLVLVRNWKEVTNEDICLDGEPMFAKIQTKTRS